MDCNSVKEHLVDFLYDEMSTESRSAFADHLHGCPTCTADLASYRHTLGNARVALSGPLAEEVPARVHRAVMEAATAAAAKATATARKAQPARNPIRPEAGLGFFARLMRIPWLLPAFGAASVATIVFLVRVLKNPEVLPGQRPHSIAENAELVSDISPLPSEPAMKAQPSELGIGKSKAAEAAPSEMGKKGGRRGSPEYNGLARSATGQREAGGNGSGGPRHTHLGSGGGSEKKLSTTSAPRDQKQRDDDVFGNLEDSDDTSKAVRAKRFAEPPPPRPAPSVPANTNEHERPTEARPAPMKEVAKEVASSPKVGWKDFDEVLSSPGRKMEGAPLAREAETKPAPALIQPAEEKVKAKAFAQAARPASSAGGMAAPAGPMARKADVASDSSLEAEAAEQPPSRTRAPTPSPAVIAAAPPVPAATAVRKSAPLAKQGSDKEVRQAVSEDESHEGTAKGQGATSPTAAQQHPRRNSPEGIAKNQNETSSFDESLRRANRLFAEQNWNAAADAYRDLLHRFPGHKDVTTWRSRVDQSVLAERESRATVGHKAAKAKASVEPIDGVKQ